MEKSLKQAALWDEVKDKLKKSAMEMCIRDRYNRARYAGWWMFASGSYEWRNQADEYQSCLLYTSTVFAMPMILGSFFQQIYNMVDSLLYKEDFAWMKKTNLVEVKLSFPLYCIANEQE